ncbi:hypothetical protein ACM66B_005302 [Microbotryomycetes sp. NB124-2]
MSTSGYEPRSRSSSPEARWISLRLSGHDSNKRRFAWRVARGRRAGEWCWRITIPSDMQAPSYPPDDAIDVPPFYVGDTDRLTAGIELAAHDEAEFVTKWRLVWLSEILTQPTYYSGIWEQVEPGSLEHFWEDIRDAHRKILNYKDFQHQVAGHRSGDVFDLRPIYYRFPFLHDFGARLDENLSMDTAFRRQRELFLAAVLHSNTRQMDSMYLSSSSAGNRSSSAYDPPSPEWGR